jgi:hypothetical protein
MTLRRLPILLILALCAASARAVVTTASGFQSALAAVARAEPNAPQADVPNRSSPIQAQGIIRLDKPLNWPGNAHAIGTGNGALLVYLGTDAPIRFYSAVDNGATADVLLDGISVFAPNARAVYEWDTSRHKGNAERYVFKNARWTANGTHFNCRAPGDGRAYWFTFENIACYGHGSMADGTPVGGLFANCFYVNNTCNNDYVIDLEPTANGIGGEARFVNCQIEPGPMPDGSAAGVFRSAGKFWTVVWDSYSEAPGYSARPMWSQDGQQNRASLHTLHFAGPQHYTVLRNGALLNFTGQPTASRDGWPVDMAISMTPALMTWSVETMRQTFICSDDASHVDFAGGKVDAKGVTSATTRPATQPER